VYAFFGIWGAVLLGPIVRAIVESYGPEKPLDERCWECGERTLFVTSSGRWDGYDGGRSFTEAECRTCGARFQNYTGEWSAPGIRCTGPCPEEAAASVRAAAGAGPATSA
jgi:hypothetical protein